MLFQSLIFTPRALYERFPGLWDFLLFTFSFYVVWKIIFQTALAGAFKRQTGGLADTQVEKYSNLLALAAALASTIAIQIRGASLQTFATSGLLEIFIALVAAVITYMSVHDPKKKNIGKAFVWSLAVFLITMIMLIAMYATENAALGNIIGIGIVVGLIVLMYALAKHTPATKPASTPAAKKTATGTELQAVINLFRSLIPFFENKVEQDWMGVNFGRGGGGVLAASVTEYIELEAKRQEGRKAADPAPADLATVGRVINGMQKVIRVQIIEYESSELKIAKALDELKDVDAGLHSKAEGVIINNFDSVQTAMNDQFKKLPGHDAANFPVLADTFYTAARGQPAVPSFSDLVKRTVADLEALKI